MSAGDPKKKDQCLWVPHKICHKQIAKNWVSTSNECLDSGRHSPRGSGARSRQGIQRSHTLLTVGRLSPAFQAVQQGWAECHALSRTATYGHIRHRVGCATVTICREWVRNAMLFPPSPRTLHPPSPYGQLPAPHNALTALPWNALELRSPPSQLAPPPPSWLIH